jgi:hypothetical protein
VGVQSNLLLLASGGIHVVVRVQVATLRVVVPERDPAAKSDICWHVMHGLGVQSCLELGGHESISLSRVNQTQEVYSKHGHVEGKGDHDETERASEQVFEPDTLLTLAFNSVFSKRQKYSLVGHSLYLQEEPKVEQW